ncbi:MAG TPA: CPBP family intramembrane glutamic endopeptidase [Woeseiaceae bacterium]|nr:CPBP family intramembrane glutamic endopeptidase [Woeseiaceae bacterium]
MTQSIARPVFQVSIAAIMLFQVAALFARSRLELSLMAHGVSEAVAEDLSYLVVPPILLALGFPYLKQCNVQLLGLFRRSGLTWQVVVLSLLLGLTLRITRWSVLTVLMWTGLVANEDPHAVAGPLIGFHCPSPPVLILSLGVMSLLVPMIEEVVNRGFILHALLPRGVALSVTLSAVLFALTHPPAGYAAAFVAGVLLSIRTLNSGTLWPAVIAHAAYNTAAVIDWECFRIVWNPPASDPQLAVAGMIAAPVAVIATAVAVVIVTRKTAGAS